MRRVAVSFAAVCALAGCGSSGPDATPVACLGGPGAYLRALEAAPAAVRLEGDTPISACLPTSQAAGDQEQVGGDLVRVATALNAAARRDPGGARNLQLGYLVGAVEAGAGDNAVHVDLLRRIQAAARFPGSAGGLPARFDVAYASGFAAGRSQG